MKKFLFLVFLAAGLCAGAVSPRAGVSILGDSYSTFEGHMLPDTNLVWYHAVPDLKHTDVTDVKQTWWQQLIRQKGWRLEVNNSYSGSTICNRGYDGKDYTDRSFLTRAKDLGSPDVILIFGGTNDSWAGVKAGTYETPKGKKPDYYTLRPALDRMLREMKDYYPGTDIYFIVNTGLRPEVTESIVTLCERHGVKVIRLSDIDKMAGHPSVKGMTAIAEQVGAAID